MERVFDVNLGETLSIRDASGDPVIIGTHAGRELFARLIRAEGNPLARERLAQEIWPELPRARALQCLRQRLCDLRKHFEPELEVSRLSIALRPAAFRCKSLPKPSLTSLPESLKSNPDQALECALSWFEERYLGPGAVWRLEPHLITLRQWTNPNGLVLAARATAEFIVGDRTQIDRLAREEAPRLEAERPSLVYAGLIYEAAMGCAHAESRYYDALAWLHEANRCYERAGSQMDVIRARFKALRTRLDMGDSSVLGIQFAHLRQRYAACVPESALVILDANLIFAYALGREFELAEAAYQRAIRISTPFLDLAYLNRSTAFLDAGQHQRATSAMRDAIEELPPERIHHGLLFQRATELLAERGRMRMAALAYGGLREECLSGRTSISPINQRRLDRAILPQLRSATGVWWLQESVRAQEMTPDAIRQSILRELRTIL